MTKPNIKKFTLYLEVNGTVEYSFFPEPNEFINNDNFLIYNFLVDVNNKSTIKIKVNKLADNKSWMQVKKLLLNNIETNDINSTGFFVSEQKEVKRNNGWINEPGEFIIRLHSNIISHNFLNYLIDLTKSKK